MSTVTLHPFGSGPARNRAVAPVATPPVPSSIWSRLATRYWAGWDHYARAYGAEVDQRPVLPLPSDPPVVVTAKLPRWIVIR